MTVVPPSPVLFIPWFTVNACAACLLLHQTMIEMMTKMTKRNIKTAPVMYPTLIVVVVELS